MESRYSSMSSEIWKKEVIAQRGEYSQRLKQVRHISEKESLSWHTAKLSDGEGGRIKPTELSEGGFRSLRKKSNKWFGSKLRDAVETHEEKNWPTPRANDEHHALPHQEKSFWHRKNRHYFAEVVIAETLGLHDQEKSSTSGKSQESWATPTQGLGMQGTPGNQGRSLVKDLKIKTTSRLNPNWVEQLMGLPVGWTQLPTEWID